MMNRRTFFAFMLLLLSHILIFSLPAFAELKFDWGPYLRVRHEYWKNLFDFDNDRLDTRNFFRIKTSLWGKADLDENTDFYIKLTNENKAYAYYGVNSTGNKEYRYDINEVVFDNLYFEARGIFSLPLDVKFGRQDFPTSSYGEGFLIADGGPRDGSRTYYFNAAKGAWHVNDGNTLEFIALKAPQTDDILPIINRQDGEQALNYSDEYAFMLYHRSDALKNLHLENYYIYKREAKDRPAPLIEKSRINTFGSYAKYSFAPWTLRGQLAYQTGTYGNKDRRGIGIYGYIDRDFKDAVWSPQASMGYYYLSGGSRNAHEYKGFDQLFSTYAWMSELYNLSYMDETGTGYWTNLKMWRASLALNLTKKAKATILYNFLKANKSMPGVHSSFGRGKNRGHLPQARFDYAINKNITTYFLAEYFLPGDFYMDKADSALFLRTELQFKF